MQLPLPRVNQPLLDLLKLQHLAFLECWRRCNLCPSMQELGDLRSRLAQVEAAAQQQEQGPRRRRPSSLRDLVAAAAAEPITGDLPAHWQASVQQLQDSSLDTRSSSLHSSSESVMDMATVEVPVRALQCSEHRACVSVCEALPQVRTSKALLHAQCSAASPTAQSLQVHKGCRSGLQQADSQPRLALSLLPLPVRCSLPDPLQAGLCLGSLLRYAGGLPCRSRSRARPQIGAARPGASSSCCRSRRRAARQAFRRRHAPPAWEGAWG